MRRVMRLRRVSAHGLARPASFDRVDEYATHQSLAGYILAQLPTPPGMVRGRTSLLVVTSPLGEIEVDMPMPLPPSSGGADGGTPIRPGCHGSNTKIRAEDTAHRPYPAACTQWARLLHYVPAEAWTGPARTGRDPGNYLRALCA
jgi:hypothetical protein